MKIVAIVALLLAAGIVAVTHARHAPTPTGEPDSFSLVLKHHHHGWSAKCDYGCAWTEAAYRCDYDCRVLVTAEGMTAAPDDRDTTTGREGPGFAFVARGDGNGWVLSSRRGTRWVNVGQRCAWFLPCGGVDETGTQGI